MGAKGGLVLINPQTNRIAADQPSILYLQRKEIQNDQAKFDPSTKATHLLHLLLYPNKTS